MASQNICDNPRAMGLIDEWISSARPPQLPQESLSYESWGRMVGLSKTAVISYNGPPNTPLSRCEYIWQWADQYESTNMGTLKEYVMSRL